MSFSDDDLKRLKELEVLRQNHSPYCCVFCIELPNLESLLARLEAAEAVCKSATNWHPLDSTFPNQLSDKLEVWRKLCGK